MQIFDGCDAILKTDDPASLKAGFFVQLADTVHENWFKCDRSKPPSSLNWRFRVAEKVTFNPSTNYEKQLEKAIVTIFADEGWGNAVPTASGLVDSGNRQRNIDLVHRIPNGFEFIELKWKANNPVAAALQTSKYAALYLLFRLQPRLRKHFPSNEMLSSDRVIFEVLAPFGYYKSKYDLQLFERSLTSELQGYCAKYLPKLTISFRYRCFPQSFIYTPGMNKGIVRWAIEQRATPFPTGASSHV